MSSKRQKECEQGRCPYGMVLTPDESSAAQWLMKTLRSMTDKKGPNAGKAETMLGLLRRTGDHMQMLSDRIHEVEDVLESVGMHEIDISEIERLAPGELN